MSQFSLMIGDSWPETMYETMRAASESHGYENQIPFYIYFMPIYFIFSHMFCSLVIKQRRIFSINSSKLTNNNKKKNECFDSIKKKIYIKLELINASISLP